MHEDVRQRSCRYPIPHNYQEFHKRFIMWLVDHGSFQDRQYASDHRRRRLPRKPIPVRNTHRGPCLCQPKLPGLIHRSVHDALRIRYPIKKYLRSLIFLRQVLHTTLTNTRHPAQPATATTTQTVRFLHLAVARLHEPSC